MSQPTESACPTRQQLDELEALMQRMLTLPVSEGEEAPAPPVPEPKLRPTILPPRLRAIPDPPPWDDREPAASPAPPPPQDLQPAPPPPAPTRPVLSPRSATPPPAPIIRSERVRMENFPVVAAAPPPPAVEQAEAPPVEEPQPTPRPRAVRPRSFVAGEPQEMWWLMPLVWSNHAFDRCTVHMGKSGRWLRGARGRAWIGWTGVLFFMMALAWAMMEWLGWP